VKTLSDVERTIKIAADYARKDAAYADKESRQVRDTLDDANTHYDDYMNHLKNHTAAYYKVDRDIVVAEDVSAKKTAANAKLFADHAQYLQKNVAELSVSPDPPVDSILHSVQFVVSYGASITPSWTFVNWKGPGINTPEASTQGVRTHILQLALGPRTPSSKVSTEQERLIQNATILSTRP
jgi:hypothetical protein